MNTNRSGRVFSGRGSFSKRRSQLRKDFKELNLSLSSFKPASYNWRKVKKNDMIELENIIYENQVNFIREQEEKGDEITINTGISLMDTINALNDPSNYFLSFGNIDLPLINSRIQTLNKLISGGFDLTNQEGHPELFRELFGVDTFEAVGSDQQRFIKIIAEGADRSVFNLKPRKVTKHNRRQGGLFPFISRLDKLNLRKYGIFNNMGDAYENYQYGENCLIQALIASKQCEMKDIAKVRDLCNTPFIQLKNVGKIAKRIHKTIVITKHHPTCKINKSRTYSFNKGASTPIKIGLAANHYFLYEKVEITRFATKHYFKVCNQENFNSIYKQVKDRFDKEKRRYIDSFNLITLLLQLRETHLIPFKPCKNIDQQKIKDQTEYFEYMDFEEEENSKDFKLTYKEPEISPMILYCDFETAPETIIHTPFVLCVKSENGEIKKTFIGQDCALQFLFYLRNLPYKNFLCIFHNLRYDFTFFMKELNIKNWIKIGNSIKTANTHFGGKEIQFKDSYSLIPMRLGDFGKCFELETCKDVCPYGIYTSETINKDSIVIEKAIEWFKKHSYTENEASEKIDQFLLNLQENNFITPDGLSFYHLKYAVFYCEKDVEVLSKGYQKFRGWMKDITTFNIDYVVSLAGLVNLYFISNGVYDGVKKLSGVPRAFIQKAVVGGRTMTRDNKKWHVKGLLQDFDFVSLYPSAMVRLMGLLKGLPKVLTPDQMNKEFLGQIDGYFIQVKITKINKPLHFPIFNYIKNGIRNFTNNLEEADTIIIDKFTFEDLIQFQDIEYEILRGYYFDEGRNYELKERIQFLFNERLRKKKEGNPIQIAYKLMMNSAYGKMIEKARLTDYTFKKDYLIKNKKGELINEYEIYMSKNYTNILHAECLTERNSKYRKFAIKIEKDINDHFSAPHCGAEVLGMSKRLVNEVICLAEEKDIFIAYTDTDSMHIDNSKLELISTEYYKKYNRKLVGKEMGQAHCDFEVGQDKGTLPVSVESYFLGKKSYIDKIKCQKKGKDEIDYHIRMKGIDGNLIERENDKMGVYDELYRGKKKEFDLAEIRPCFEYKTLNQVNSKESMKRTIQFKGEKCFLQFKE